MASNITFNGVTYSIPAVGDDGWGSDLSAYFIAIASGALQKTGGNFTLTAEANFGATFGLKSAYLKSQATNPASAGIVRLGNNESISWRNFANNADINLKVNTSDSLEFNGASILYGLILNANVDPAAAIALSKLATVTASRVLVSDVSGIITASAITTTTLAFLDATSSIQTQLDAKANSASPTFTGTVTLPSSIVSGAATLTFPTATGTFSTLAGTEVITNKDIDGGTAANTRRITLPKNTLTNLTSLTRKQGTLVFDTTSNKPYYDDGSNLRVIGSGSGGAGNLIDDGDGEAGITNYAEGSYSAATRPAGTFTASSGTGTFAIGTTTTTPIAGNTSLTLTKSSGASRQGRAVERTISLDLENRAKVLEMRIKYIVVSGTFVAGSSSADSSLIWYIGQFNGSTWTYTEPSSFKMLSNSTTISDVLIGNFQTNYDTTQVKLIAYVAESTNSAWEVKCEVAVQPCNYVYGTPITDNVAYTPSNSQGFGTLASVDLRWSRKGDTLSIEGGFTSGTVTGSIAQLGLPNGLTIGGTTGKRYHVGELIRAGGTRVTVFAIQGNNYLTFGGGASSQGDVVGSSLVGSTEVLLISASEIPIQGWSSSTQVSDGYDGRLIAARYTTTGGVTSWSNNQVIKYTTLVFDKTNSYSPSTGLFTCPSAGLYRVTAQFYGTTNFTYIYLGKNGSSELSRLMQSATSGNTGSILVECNAGDTLGIYNAAATVSSVDGAGYNSVSFEKLSAPTTISATEVVAFMAEGASSSAAGSNVTIPFNTPSNDTHGGWNSTNKDWTAPYSGIYKITCASRLTFSGATVNQYMDIIIQIDGVTKREFVKYLENTGVSGLTGIVSYQAYLTAGQKIRCVLDTNLSSPVLTTGATHTYLEIFRIK